MCIGTCHAVIAHPENCTFHMWKDARFQEHLEILRVRDRFLFSIETTGVLRPKEVFVQSIDLLRRSAQSLLDCLDALDHTEISDKTVQSNAIPSC